jgi:hypothetical protein
MKNFSDIIGNRTRDRLACSAVLWRWLGNSACLDTLQERYGPLSLPGVEPCVQNIVRFDVKEGDCLARMGG